MSVLTAALCHLFLPSWYWIGLKPRRGSVLGPAAPNTLWFRQQHQHVEENHPSSFVNVFKESTTNRAINWSVRERIHGLL